MQVDDVFLNACFKALIVQKFDTLASLVDHTVLCTVIARGWRVQAGWLRALSSDTFIRIVYLNLDTSLDVHVSSTGTLLLVEAKLPICPQCDIAIVSTHTCPAHWTFTNCVIIR